MKNQSRDVRNQIFPINSYETKHQNTSFRSTSKTQLMEGSQHKIASLRKSSFGILMKYRVKFNYLNRSFLFRLKSASYSIGTKLWKNEGGKNC